ncbi:patatin-like phospholipase family protein [Guggenheimella bovis]
MEKIGVVLEGGGTRGSYQVGALKALKERGIEIQGVTGTSIGAINGAFVAMDKLDDLYDMYYNIDPSIYIDANEDLMEGLRKEKLSFVDLISSFPDIIKRKGINIDPLKKRIEEYIDEERIRKGSIHYGLVLVNLSTRESKELLIDEIPEGKLHEYIMASAYLPVFSQEKREYMDGGLHNNIPLDLLLRSDEYTKIYILRTHGVGRHQKLESSVPLVTISPQHDLGSILSFDRELSRENILAGYYDMIRELDSLKGSLYYLKDIPEDFFFSLLCNIPEEVVLKSAKTLNLGKDRPFRRIVFEEMVPVIQTITGLTDESDYERLGLRLLELYALDRHIPRFEIYSFETFLEKVEEGMKKEEKATIDLVSQLQAFFAKRVSFKVGEYQEIISELCRCLLGGRNVSRNL